MDTISNSHVRPKTNINCDIRTQEPGQLIAPEQPHESLALPLRRPRQKARLSVFHISLTPDLLHNYTDQPAQPSFYTRTPRKAPQQQSRPEQAAKPPGSKIRGRRSQACKKITGRQQCWGWPLTLPAPSGPGARRLMSPFPHSRSSMALVCSICQPTGPGPRIVEFPLPPDYLIVQPAPAPVATPRWPRDSPTWPHWGSWEDFWMMGNLVRLDNAPVLL